MVSDCLWRLRMGCLRRMMTKEKKKKRLIQHPLHIYTTSRPDQTIVCTCVTPQNTHTQTRATESQVCRVKVGCGIRIQDRDSFPEFWRSHSGFSRGTKKLHHSWDAHRVCSCSRSQSSSLIVLTLDFTLEAVRG